ncbi:Centrosomal protein [Dirofilaria immitis]
MDSDILDLKQAIIDKLRYNGTLDRIQAELRCAVFLAIEDTENKRVEVDENKLNQKFGYSMIYHFLRQNRFLATAAVFEKEMQQKIISLEELKKENAATFCFQFFGDNITLSDITLTGTEQKMAESSSIRIRRSETNDTESEHSEKNNGESDLQTIDKQQIVNFESNKTSKSVTSDNEISRNENGILNSSIRNEWKNEGEIRNDRSLRKSINDEIQKYSKGSSSRSESPKIFEQKQQTSDISSVRISKDQQQSPKHITSLSASYSGKLPPIATPTNQSNPSIKLPSIPSLNSPLTQTKTVAFSRMLDTVLNSSSSNISEIDEDIAEEIILDDMLQSDNNSDATISF